MSQSWGRTASTGLTFEHHDMNERPDSEGRTYHRLMAINGDDKAVGMLDYKRGESSVHPFSVSARETHVQDALHGELQRRHPEHEVVQPGPPQAVHEPEPETFFHGTTVSRVKRIMPANEHRKHVTFPSDTSREHAYATSSEDDAWSYAQRAWHASPDVGGHPRVYEVRPRGHYEKDPQFDEHGKSRSNFSGDYRSKEGWDVVREVKMPAEMGKPKDWR